MVKTRATLLGAVLGVSMTGAVSAQTVPLDEAHAPAEPTIRVVAKQPTVVPGGRLTAEVFVGDVTDLSVYQVTLGVVTGGTGGGLILQTVHIDSERPEYVFGSASVVKGEAVHSGQAGAMRVHGSTDVGRSAYLGTYTFQASADASGTFELKLKSGQESFLLDSTGRAIPFRPGRAVTIAVAEPSPNSLDTRKK